MYVACRHDLHILRQRHAGMLSEASKAQVYSESSSGKDGHLHELKTLKKVKSIQPWYVWRGKIGPSLSGALQGFSNHQNTLINCTASACNGQAAIITAKAMAFLECNIITAKAGHPKIHQAGTDVPISTKTRAHVFDKEP